MLCICIMCYVSRFLKIDQKQNKELTEEITKLESDRKMLESANTQLIEEKHQLETSVMQVQAENDQLKSKKRLRTIN